MKTNFESRFMQVALSGGSQMTDVELTAEFESFQREVRNLLMSDNGYIAIDFTLRDLLAQFDGIVRCKKNEHLWTLIKRAKAKLRTCIAQNEKRLTFPDLFAPTIPPPRSPLHWNVKKYPKISLVSLITALDAVGVCTNSKGEQSPFIAIVQELEYLFNTSLPNAYARRDGNRHRNYQGFVRS